MVSATKYELSTQRPNDQLGLSVEESKLLLERVERLEVRLRETYLRRDRQRGGDLEKRLGSILVRNLRKPWLWPLIPLQMYRAVKYHRQMSLSSSSDGDLSRAAATLYDRSRHIGVQS